MRDGTIPSRSFLFARNACMTLSTTITNLFLLSVLIILTTTPRHTADALQLIIPPSPTTSVGPFATRCASCQTQHARSSSFSWNRRRDSRIAAGGTVLRLGGKETRRTREFSGEEEERFNRMPIVEDEYYEYEDGYDGEEEYDYEEEEEEEEYVKDKPSRSRNRYYDEEEEEEYEDDAAGNFWSNPSDSRRAEPSRRRRDQPSTTPSIKRKSRSPQRTFRSGTPPPPNILTSFYNQFFWYGLDTEEDSGDTKKFFGGTKGKFNGLGLLEDGMGRQERPRRQMREDDFRERRDRDDGYYREEEEDYDSRPRRQQRRGGDGNSLPPSGRQLGSRRGVQNEVSDWFTSTNDYDDEDDDDDYREENYDQPRDRQKRTKNWNMENFMDEFLNVDTSSRQKMADSYDKRMGLKKPRVKGEGRQKQGGVFNDAPVETIKYKDDGMPPVADILDEQQDENMLDRQDEYWDDDDDDDDDNFRFTNKDKPQTTPTPPKMDDANSPPEGIPAWGPQGEIPNTTARDLYLTELKTSIQSQTQVKIKLNNKLEEASEEVTAWKEHALRTSRKMKQLDVSRTNLRSRLRRIEAGVEEASRRKRGIQNRLRQVLGDLHELEERYGCVAPLDPLEGGEDLTNTDRESEDDVVDALPDPDVITLEEDGVPVTEQSGAVPVDVQLRDDGSDEYIDLDKI